MNTQTTYYTTRDIAKTMRAPGAAVGPILSDAGVQPVSVRITQHTHRYQWSEAAMEAARKYRAEKDIEVAAKKKAAAERKALKEKGAEVTKVQEAMKTMESIAAQPVQKELPFTPDEFFKEADVAIAARRHNKMLERLDIIEAKIDSLIALWTTKE